MTKIGRENWLFPKSSRYNYLEPYSKTGSRWNEETNIKKQKHKTTKRKYKILKNIYGWRVFLNSEKTYTNLFQTGNCFPFYFRTSCIVIFPYKHALLFDLKFYPNFF